MILLSKLENAQRNIVDKKIFPTLGPNIDDVYMYGG